MIEIRSLNVVTSCIRTVPLKVRFVKLGCPLGLVLVVSEVCARGYGAGRVRERSTKGEGRIVGRSAAGGAVGVAEENPLRHQRARRKTSSSQKTRELSSEIRRERLAPLPSRMPNPLLPIGQDCEETPLRLGDSQSLEAVA